MKNKQFTYAISDLEDFQNTQAVLTFIFINGANIMSPFFMSVFNQTIIMETNKLPLLIEKAQEDPMYVIKQVFESDPKHLFYVMKNWLLIALVGEHYAYETSDQRKALLAFYESLQVLLVALDIHHSRATDKECCIYCKGSDPSDDYFEFYLFTQEKANNPRQIIEAFFNQYSIDHIRRELADWLEAGIDYEGIIPGGNTKRHLFSTHKDVMCLVEAAYHLIQEEEKP